MRRRFGGNVAGPALALLAIGLLFPLSAGSQEKPDAQKIYADVAGTYEFVYEGESLTIVFYVKDGRLYGREESGGEDSEVMPLDLDKLKFETTVQSTGQYYEIVFTRDENGEVNTCRLLTGEIEIDGKRVK
ncbi:MAG: hypothetical protein WBC70_07685 [Candidatus Aminicenantales bacterium]